MSDEARAAERRTSGPGPRGEIKALTGLRAVAATWVVLYHVAWLSSAYLDQAGFLRPILASGWTGVELFFVLSGFVIARSYLEEMGASWSTGAAARFLYNRLARVWPAYAVVTLVAFVWLLLIGHLGWAVDVVARHPEPTLGELAQQLAMVQMWDAGSLKGQSFNLPGWSVSAEWLAYLAFPVLALVLRPMRRLPAVLLLGLACVSMLPLFLTAYVHGTSDVATNWVLRIACCFVAGVLACLAVRHLERGARAEQWGLVLAVSALVGVVAICFWAQWRSTIQPGVYSGVATILYPLLVSGLALTRRGPSRVLANETLTYGGRLSYCLYLVHFLVMDVVVTWYWQDEARRGDVPPALALGIPLIVLASFALAAVLHHGVEEPARLHMLRWLRRRDAVPSTAGERSPAVAPAHASAVVRPRSAPEPPTERLAVGAHGDERAVQRHARSAPGASRARSAGLRPSVSGGAPRPRENAGHRQP